MSALAGAHDGSDGHEVSQNRKGGGCAAAREVGVLQPEDRRVGYWVSRNFSRSRFDVTVYPFPDLISWIPLLILSYSSSFDSSVSSSDKDVIRKEPRLVRSITVWPSAAISRYLRWRERNSLPLTITMFFCFAYKYRNNVENNREFR